MEVETPNSVMKRFKENEDESTLVDSGLNPSSAKDGVVDESETAAVNDFDTIETFKCFICRSARLEMSTMRFLPFLREDDQ